MVLQRALLLVQPVESRNGEELNTANRESKRPNRIEGIIASKNKTFPVCQPTHFVYIPLDALLEDDPASYKIRMDIPNSPVRDIVIVPEYKEILLSESKLYYSNILVYNEFGGLIREIEEPGWTLSMLHYDRYLYHAGWYGIKRLDLESLLKEIIEDDLVTDPIDLLKINGKGVVYDIKFANNRWYVLIRTKKDTYALFSTNSLENPKKWRQIPEMQWEEVSLFEAGFDILPDNSVITNIPRKYFDINRRQIIKVQTLEGDLPWKFRTGILEKDKILVVYAGSKHLGYVVLRKNEDENWEVEKSNYFKEIGYPIELVTESAYNSIVKNLIA